MVNSRFQTYNTLIPRDPRIEAPAQRPARPLQRLFRKSLGQNSKSEPPVGVKQTCKQRDVQDSQLRSWHLSSESLFCKADNRL